MVNETYAMEKKKKGEEVAEWLKAVDCKSIP